MGMISKIKWNTMAGHTEFNLCMRIFSIFLQFGTRAKLGRTGPGVDFIKNHDLPQIRFHDLRHTFASPMHHGGVGIKDISGALGHSNLSTTSEIYTHLLDETFVNQLSVMDKSFPK